MSKPISIPPKPHPGPPPHPPPPYPPPPPPSNPRRNALTPEQAQAYHHASKYSTHLPSAVQKRALMKPPRQGQDPGGNSTQPTNPRLNTREPQGPKSQAVPPTAVHRPGPENTADGRYVPKPKPWSPPRPPRPDAPNSSTLSVSSAILSRASRYNATQANSNNKDKAPQYPSVRETSFSGPSALSEIIKILEVYCTGRGPSSDLVNVPKEIIVEKLKAEDVLAAVWEEPRFWEMVGKDGCAEKMVGLLGSAVMDLVGRDVKDGGHGEDEERVIMW